MTTATQQKLSDYKQGMPLIILQILVFLIFPMSIMGQSEKPQTIVVPTASLGEITEVRKKMLEMTLISNLDDHFAIVPKDLFEEAQEKAFEELDYEECTEEQCIMMIKEILQVENSFQLVVLAEDDVTQISVIWNDLDQKKVEEEFCEGCKTKELSKTIENLVQKLIGINKEIEIKEEPSKKVESKPINVIEKQSESTQEKLSSNEEWTEPKTGMQFVKIPGKSYWIGKYEVTQGEWEKLIGVNPSGNQSGAKYPIENISWKMANEFSKRLSKLYENDILFRLPTRDEWFNACNANNFMNLYGTRDGLLNRNLANYGKVKCCGPDPSDGYELTSPVGSYPPNELGIYDMSGNVREFTLAPEGDKLFQGGGWNNSPSVQTCNILQRNYDYPNEQDPDVASVSVGFRLVLEHTDKSKIKVLSNTVIDSSTSMMWQKEIFSEYVNWWGAVEYCENLILDNYNDWSLPSKKDFPKNKEELSSKSKNLFISKFHNIQDSQLWIKEREGKSAWTVDYTLVSPDLFQLKDPFWEYKVRCVRKIKTSKEFKETNPSSKKSHSSSNTVIDPSTGLMWQKKPDGNERNWKNAKRYCDSLDLKGFKNWELPSQPVLNMMLSKKDIFDDYKKDGWYWTSTLNSKITLNRSAAMIGFKSKYNGFSPIKDKYLVRCVRNINE